MRSDARDCRIHKESGHRQPAEPEEVAVPEETLFQRVAAQLAMLGALLAILLGVLLLIAAAR